MVKENSVPKYVEIPTEKKASGPVKFSAGSHITK